MTERERYAFNRFSEACDILATHEGDIGKRLIKACYTFFAAISDKDMPDYLRADFNKIIKQITTKDAIRDYEGNVIYPSFYVSIRGRRKKTLIKIAKQIIELKYKLELLFYENKYDSKLV